MKITAVQVTPTKTVPLNTQAATLDEMSRALPQGLYTTFMTLAHGSKVMGLHNHLKRLYEPAAQMNLQPAVDEQTLRARIAALVQLNLPNESRVRLTLAKDSGKIYIGIQPFAPLPEDIYKNGVHVVTSSITRHDPRIKDTGFIMESTAQRKLVNKDIFEVLLSRNGKILEGMTSNFYAIASGKNTRFTRPTVKLITAQRGILLGVTRKAVIQIARGAGLRIEYRAPDVNEKFDEAFLTSSSRGVVPITAIEGEAIGRGSVGKWTTVLMKAYQNFIEQKSENII